MRGMFDVKPRSKRWSTTLLGMVTLMAILLRLHGVACAKRAAPPSVSPVVAHGVRYQPSYEHYEFGMVGLIEAWDTRRNARLWRVPVYAEPIDPRMEKDVQESFFSSLKLQTETQLVATTESGERVVIDLETGTIVGRGKSKAR